MTNVTILGNAHFPSPPPSVHDEKKMASDSNSPDGGVNVTSLIQEPLSRDWVINDAKIFLEKKGDDGVRSENFSIPFPKTSNSEDLTEITWHLRVSKNGEFFYVRLYQGPREAGEKVREGASKISIVDCNFRIVNTETGDLMYAGASDYNTGCEFVICNESRFECGRHVLKYADIDKYLCHGSLRIQVEAKVLFLTDLMESILVE